jgi:DNA-binding CsgD family transcriptional regulator
MMLGQINFFLGRPRLSAELFDAALAESDDDGALRCRLHVDLAWSHVLLRDDLTMAADHAAAAIDLAERLDDGTLLVLAHSAGGLAGFLLGRGTPGEVMRVALEVEPRSAAFRAHERATLPYAALLIWADELDEARAQLERLHAVAEQQGDESAFPWILARRAYLEWLAGNWSQAVSYADEAHDVAVAAGHRSEELVANGAKALASAHLGRIDDARAAAADSLAGQEESGGLGSIAARGALGFLALSLGEAAEADRILAPLLATITPRALGEAEEIRFLPDELEALVTLARLGEAERLLVSLEVYAGAPSRSFARATVERCRGLLLAARGRQEEAIASFERALTRCEEPPFPFERARTLLALGATHRRAKQKARARASLERSLTTFEQLGATLWAAKARSEIGSIGGRAPSPRALTPTEQRIAALVAEGRTNREVAAELFVTNRTVEGHLSKIYAKLGLRSRAELAKRFADLEARPNA